MRFAWLVVFAACWSSSESTDQRPIVVEEPAPAPPPPLKRPAHSVWTGRYVCAQGPTALTLTLDHDGPHLTGTFEFGPLDENPTVPRGSYHMTGTATTTGGNEVTVKLEGVEWIDRPNNYVMVGIEATTDRERRLLTGHITYATCGAVELSRVE